MKNLLIIIFILFGINLNSQNPFKPHVETKRVKDIVLGYKINYLGEKEYARYTIYKNPTYNQMYFYNTVTKQNSLIMNRVKLTNAIAALKRNNFIITKSI